jgi:hypothetical protein
MLTTDLSLRYDPAYEKISRRFLENPDEFAHCVAPAGLLVCSHSNLNRYSKKELLHLVGVLVQGPHLRKNARCCPC